MHIYNKVTGDPLVSVYHKTEVDLNAHLDMSELNICITYYFFSISLRAHSAKLLIHQVLQALPEMHCNYSPSHMQRRTGVTAF